MSELTNISNLRSVDEEVCGAHSGPRACQSRATLVASATSMSTEIARGLVLPPLLHIPLTTHVYARGKSKNCVLELMFRSSSVSCKSNGIPLTFSRALRRHGHRAAQGGARQGTACQGAVSYHGIVS